MADEGDEEIRLHIRNITCFEFLGKLFKDILLRKHHVLASKVDKPGKSLLPY
jgi:hypothetical protein